MKQKIAFVCQRYGMEVNGGAELYCREIAEHLSGEYDVTVYTTCAIDYLSWRNEYKAGESDLNSVHIKRFETGKEREREKFDWIYTRMLNSDVREDKLEQSWINEQGPYCPELIRAVKKEASTYSVVFFMTYLYYTTIEGMKLDLPNAVLIPTIHDEPPAYFHCYDQVFANAKAIAWNTPEEQAFALKRFPGIVDTPCEMTGIGIEIPEGDWPELPEQLQEGKYLLYAGRIDENKGCKELISFFLAYKSRRPNDIKLVLIGKTAMPIPDDPDIVYLGFVSEEMKYVLMKNSLALALFSHFESLSIVLLESMLMGRPVLVSAKCEVLKGHCIRSNAGLYIEDYGEFVESIQYILHHEEIYSAMRQNGIRYVEQNYRWSAILDKYKSIIQKVSNSKQG